MATFGSPANRKAYLDPEIHYECQRCTACCRWPGDVRVEDDEISRIATYLNLDSDEFMKRFTRLRTNRQGLSLIEHSDHSCIMLKEGGCQIHEVKPAQCAGFPNRWNFPGWRKVCEAVPIHMVAATARGLVGETDE